MHFVQNRKYELRGKFLSTQYSAFFPTDQTASNQNGSNTTINHNRVTNSLEYCVAKFSSLKQCK